MDDQRHRMMTGISKRAALAIAAITLACGLALGWYARDTWSRFAGFQPVAVVSPVPAAVVSVSPRPNASAVTHKAATNPQIPMPSASVPMLPPAAPPRIVAVAISSPVAIGGQLITGTVKTSSNVASVEARIAGYSAVLTKVGVGEFALAYRVPKLPFFLHRTYTIDVIARNVQGDAVSSSLSVTVR